jgi:transcription initiation factor TFIID subunit 2
MHPIPTGAALTSRLQYSDAYYVCSLISALAAAVVPTRPPERNELATTEITGQQTEEDAQLLNEAISEVQRYQSMDRLIPSVHNIVTIATLEVHSAPFDACTISD